MSSRGALALRIAPASDPPYDDRTDDALMQLAATGSRRAYETLVRRHQRRVRAYCARCCASSALGDDVAQECFVELWQRRVAYDPRGKFTAYLFRIAANRCKNARRKRGRETELAGHAELDVQRVAAPEELIAEQRRRHVQQSLHKLPAPQREAILLRYGAELGYEEIARMLGKPEPTIRSRVFLGLVKLRKLLRLERLT